MLTISDVCAGYGPTRIIHNLDLQVSAGTVTALLGHNGAGKSTLLRCCMGIVKQTDGSIIFNGEDITRLRPHERVRRGIGYVAQGQVSFPQLSAAENLRVVTEAHRNSGTTVDDVLDLFPALSELLDRPAGLLSGGQRQQLSIARTLLTGPRLLLLDEPTEGIQPNVVKTIEAAISELTASRGITALLVEQHIGFALSAASHYYVLDRGRISRHGAGGPTAKADVIDAMRI